MRRRPGIGGLQNAAAARDQYRLLGENVAKLRTDLMKEQLATFRSQLEDFARKHKNDIRKNPTFRTQFHEMCAKVGVDPLASNKGFWAELLGIGDFYYELVIGHGVKIIVYKINLIATVLGSGFEVISVGKKKLIRSVPTELNKDHNEILELAQEGLAMIDDGHKDAKRRYWFPCVSSISSVIESDAITI
ncbi:hypothetical protein Cgig2_029624 [Carnegiea gigantea]|uniref:Vacuolar-sorting protein SNF8 n=1 Tax=Carnegiea gigantea TaxID=171969 RepID=A0A9Q1KHR4_9CARY|nr:hypothetical protein Cgig2_029624 [Carnegiea gigantea]